MGALDCVTVEGMKSTESTEVFAISTTNLSEQRRDVESQFSKSNTPYTKHSIWWSLATDLPLVVLVVVLVVLFEKGLIPHHRSGFFCNDPALSFTYNGDSVSATALMVPVLLLPLILILPTEYLFIDSGSLKRSRTVQAGLNTLWLYRTYTYGLLVKLCVLELLKGLMGNPRPIFFDVCQPDTGKTCTGSEFVSEFKCTSTKFSRWFMDDTSHSFPSGHASFSVYCALFLCWYLQRRGFNWNNRSVFIVPFLHIGLLAFAAACSVTRITDHVHHWWDVLAGVGLGIVATVYVVQANKVFVSRLIHTNDVRCEVRHNGTLLFERQARDIS